MHIPIQQTPTPIYHIDLRLRYIVVLRDGQCRVWEDLENLHNWYGMPVRSAIGQTQYINQFIDPISAVWMGLVTVEELGLSEQTLAVLKLTMQDITP